MVVLNLRRLPGRTVLYADSPGDGGTVSKSQAVRFGAAAHSGGPPHGPSPRRVRARTAFVSKAPRPAPECPPRAALRRFRTVGRSASARRWCRRGPLAILGRGLRRGGRPPTRGADAAS